MGDSHFLADHILPADAEELLTSNQFQSLQDGSRPLLVLDCDCNRPAVQTGDEVSEYGDVANVLDGNPDNHSHDFGSAAQQTALLFSFRFRIP